MWWRPGEVEERTRVGAGVGRDRPDLPLLEQMPLIVQRADVGEVDAGDGQRAAAIQRLEGGRHQITDRREQDGRIQRHRRRIGCALRRRGAQRQREFTVPVASGHDVHLGASGQRDLGGDVGAAAEAVQSRAARPAAGPRAAANGSR